MICEIFFIGLKIGLIVVSHIYSYTYERTAMDLFWEEGS